MPRKRSNPAIPAGIDPAVVGRILLHALPHLEPREFRVLAALLSLVTPGQRSHLTDRQISQAAGYRANYARFVVTELRAKEIPGTAQTWVGTNGLGRSKRIIWVNDPGDNA